MAGSSGKDDDAGDQRGEAVETKVSMQGGAKVRTGQTAGKIGRDAFRERFMARFYDPAFRAEDSALERLESIAWTAYEEGRKAPVTKPAGRGFSDPGYALSVEWRAASERIAEAQSARERPGAPPRALLICGSSRNDGSCPGEMSKSYRLARIARKALRDEGMEVDVLDLSLLNSEPHRHIHPCKGCVSTAMPLCHWPCSCYPNHAGGQVNDWMNDIYALWAGCRAVMIITPVYWYQSPSPLKLMIDRLVCADGGNPDPSSTDGKDAEKAKAIELEGWPYPQHLAGRVYGVVVHGDVAGVEPVRHALSDWLEWMGLVPAGHQSRLDRTIGYYEPYATSHEALDRDIDVQREVEVAARAVALSVKAQREGALTQPDRNLRRPRQK